MTVLAQFKPRVDPWLIDESEFYELESHDDQMRFLLRYAVLAPSSHNTQPWEFRITADGVEIYADLSRRMPIIDPDDRELMMSVGAAITNFRVAAAHFGMETTVMYERRPEELVPVALVSIRETTAVDPRLAGLFPAILKRHTNRSPFDGKPIEPKAAARLREVIDRFPATLRVILPGDRKPTALLIEEAERARMARPACRSELAGWIRPEDDGPSSDGLSAETLGMPHYLAPGAAWFLRRFDLGAWQGPRARRLAESASVLLLITSGDDRVSLIRAGEAMEVLLLTIAAVGLQYSFLNQAIEVESMRERLGDMTGVTDPPQLLIRLGSAPQVEAAPPRRTPRRALQQVVTRGHLRDVSSGN